MRTWTPKLSSPGGPSAGVPAPVAAEVASPPGARAVFHRAAPAPAYFDRPARVDQDPAVVNGGQSPLPFRPQMERSFGEDFSNVRSYVGREAALRPLGAAAAAQDDTVVFGSAAPSPRQVAHELTHVVQRRNGAAPGTGTGVSDPAGGAEREAATVAAAVVRGEPARVEGRAGPEIHRDTPAQPTIEDEFRQHYAERKAKFDGQDIAEAGDKTQAKKIEELRGFSSDIDKRDLKGKLSLSSVGDGAIMGPDAAAIRARKTAAVGDVGQAIQSLATRDLRGVSKSLVRIFRGDPVPGFTTDGVPPRGSVAVVSKGGVFIGLEVVAEASGGGADGRMQLRTFSYYTMYLGASKVKLKTRDVDPADAKGVRLMGWFTPDALPELPKKAQRVAYDFTQHPSDMPADEYDAEVDKLLYIGQMAAGANWHADGSRMVRATTEKVDTGQKNKKGEPIYTYKDTGRGETIANTQANDPARYGLSQLIMPGDPTLERWKASGHDWEAISIFTTCIATSSFIVKSYLGEKLNTEFTEYGGIGGVMSPIFDVPVGGRLMREGAGFKYLQSVGAYIPRDPTSDTPFHLQKGDAYMTGTFDNAAWTFQHYSIVAEATERPDGKTDLITIDGGQGDSKSGEDKTGFTRRVYDPATGIISGARSKEIIGVWKLPVLKKALKEMPQSVRDQVRGSQQPKK